MSGFAAPAGVEQREGFPCFSGSEVVRRHGALRELMERDDLTAIVVGGISGGLEWAVHYFTNWSPLVESFVVFPRDGEPTLFARLWNHLPDARRISVVPDVRYGGDTTGEQVETVASRLTELTGGRGAIGWMGGVSAAAMLGLHARLPGVAWYDLNADYAALRMIKSDEELIFLRHAAAFNDRAIEAMRTGIRPGMREFEIVRLIEDSYLDDRGSNLIHFTSSTPMAAPTVGVPHQQQPDRVIEVGDVIVTEISSLFWGYAGQVLRSFTVGADPTPQYRELHDVATAAYDGITAILRAGVTVGEILDAAEVIHAAGFTIIDDLVHGQGGAYLPPILRTRRTRGATHPDDYAYRAGSVIVVQPNVVTADELAGVQLGNAVVITDTGSESLQQAPMGFLRCG